MIWAGSILVVWAVLATRLRLSAVAIVVPGPWICTWAFCHAKRVLLDGRRQRGALRNDLRVILDHLMAASAAGLHVRQALPRGSGEFESRLMIQTLAALDHARALGLDVNRALQCQGGRLSLQKDEGRYLGHLLVSLALCERMGVNTSRLLGALRTRLDERLALLRKLRVETAQVRFQALVLCVAPFAFGAGYAVIFPARFAYFLDSPVGHCLLCASIVSTTLGGFLTWRMAQRWGSTCA